MERIDEIDEFRSQLDSLVNEGNQNIDIDGLDFKKCNAKEKDNILLNEIQNYTKLNNKSQKIKKFNKESKEIKDKDSVSQSINSKSTFQKIKVSKDICFKCCSNKAQYVIRQESFCLDCFLNFTLHKFKSNLRANCKIRHEDNLLVAISGGLNSMLMFHLLNICLNDKTSNKKMFFKVDFLYIDESFFFTNYYSNKDINAAIKERKENFEFLTNLSKKYDFKIDFLNIENCLENNDINILFNNLDILKESNFQLNYVQILIKNMIYNYAIKNKYNKVILGSSQTSQVQNIFDKLISGRGKTINVNYTNEVVINGNKLSIMYPMKDFLEKECLIQFKLYDLNIVNSSCRNIFKINKKGSHSNLIKNFLDNLQTKAFSTTPTIISTAEKLLVNSNSELCAFCYEPKDELYNDLECGSIDFTEKK